MVEGFLDGMCEEFVGLWILLTGKMLQGLEFSESEDAVLNQLCV